MVDRPEAFTGLLSQMPILFLKMWLWAMVTVTRVADVVADDHVPAHVDAFPAPLRGVIRTPIMNIM